MENVSNRVFGFSINLIEKFYIDKVFFNNIIISIEKSTLKLCLYFSYQTIFIINKINYSFLVSSVTTLFFPSIKCLDINFAEELELTGSPLKLDLSLHTILDDTMITDEPQLWTKEEATHGPITLDTARLVKSF